MESLDGKKVKIEYPINWCYTIVARDEELLVCEVKTILEDREHILTPSKKSKTGKFISHKLEVIVENDIDRVEIFDKLKASEVFLHIL